MNKIIFDAIGYSIGILIVWIVIIWVGKVEEKLRENRHRKEQYRKILERTKGIKGRPQLTAFFERPSFWGEEKIKSKKRHEFNRKTRS